MGHYSFDFSQQYNISEQNFRVALHGVLFLGGPMHNRCIVWH